MREHQVGCVCARAFAYEKNHHNVKQSKAKKKEQGKEKEKKNCRNSTKNSRNFSAAAAGEYERGKCQMRTKKNQKRK